MAGARASYLLYKKACQFCNLISGLGGDIIHDEAVSLANNVCSHSITAGQVLIAT